VRRAASRAARRTASSDKAEPSTPTTDPAEVVAICAPIRWNVGVRSAALRREWSSSASKADSDPPHGGVGYESVPSLCACRRAATMPSSPQRGRWTRAARLPQYHLPNVGNRLPTHLQTISLSDPSFWQHH
jgi:hypothetical protein